MGVINLINQLDNLAQVIKTPNPDRPFENAIAQFGRSVCNRLSAVPSALQIGPLGGPSALCRPYWNDQGFSAPVEEPPFSGGQCPESYLLQISVTRVAPNPPETIDVRARGPILGVRVVPSTPPAWAVQLNSTGQNVGSTTCGIVSEQAQGFRNLVQGTAYVEQTATIASIIPCGADDCGDPPNEVKPGPTPAPDPGPLPPGTGFNFDVRGNPILVLPPTLEISPDFNLEVPIGEINLGADGGSTAAIAPLPSEEQAGGGSGAGGGENDFGDPPEGERWVGCCVRITELPPGTGNIPQAEPESIYPRTIGNVRLRFSGSEGFSAYDTPLVNRQKTTCVWEPVRGLNPTGVRVNLLPGFGYVFTPYSIPLEQ